MAETLEISGDQKVAIAHAMSEHTAPFISAINRVISDEWNSTADDPSARALGTGSFVELRGKPYLITNEHVAMERRRVSLAHALRQGDDPDNRAFRIINPFQVIGAPTDAAISRIEDDVWEQGQKMAIPAVRIACAHEPVPGERLFVQGFPGEFTRATSFLPGNVARPVAFLTEEIELPERLDAEFYFALHYSPEWARTAGNVSVNLPLPSGFSGSFVWDTKYVRVRGRNWTPRDAVVTGLLRAWPQGEHANRLLGVRIEVVRAFLMRALRLEAAYFRSLNRQKHSGDALSDWLWAERTITDL